MTIMTCRDVSPTTAVPKPPLLLKLSRDPRGDKPANCVLYVKYIKQRWMFADYHPSGLREKTACGATTKDQFPLKRAKCIAVAK